VTDPRSFGRFQIVRELGRGANGLVFEALDPRAGRTVALKLLRAGERATNEEIERLRREAEALARIRHPNVVVVHEAGMQDGLSYLVLEPVIGDSLAEAMKTLPQARVLELLEQVARGLHAAHEAGVLHRDVKPANVLVERDGHARLVDFGLARITDASVDLTQTGTVMGTPAYMSPEATRGERASIGRTSDIYSLGAILYEVLTGGTPYADARSVVSLAARVASAPPVPRARTKRPGIPAALDDLCARALEKDPSRRIGTALAFADGLALARGGRERGRRVGPAVLASLVLASLGLLGVVAALTVSRPEPTVALSLTVTEPAAGRLVKDGETVPVVGATNAPEVTINGVRATRRSDGSFAARVPIAATTSAIVVVARREAEVRTVTRALGRGSEAPPAWFLMLPESERPRLPLRPGLSFGVKAGEYVNAKDGSVLVFVPAGTFLMGSAEGDEDERPVHEVHLSAYFLGKYELEASRFEAFVEASGYVTTAEEEGGGIVLTPPGLVMVRTSSWRYPEGDGRAPAPGDPVCQVSWNDAHAYLAWAGLTLPTEAQWERAAGWDANAHRALRYSWGDETPSATSRLLGNLTDEAIKRGFPRAAIFEGYDDGYPKRSPVGTFPLGASPVGALDMTGNVAEWCEDGYDETFFARSPRDDPVRSIEGLKFHVTRGGCFQDPPKDLRLASRNKGEALEYNETLGFRVALPEAR
jgi:serine/threonine-protein kinase